MWIAACAIRHLQLHLLNGNARAEIVTLVGHAAADAAQAIGPDTTIVAHNFRAWSDCAVSRLGEGVRDGARVANIASTTRTRAKVAVGVAIASTLPAIVALPIRT